MLYLDDDTRSQIFRKTLESIEQYHNDVESIDIMPRDDGETIQEWLKKFDFSRPADPLGLIEDIVGQLRKNQVHTSHPGYYGLFNPTPATMGVVADTLVASFNPQLAAWNHSPFAIELEQHLIRSIGELFGYEGSVLGGTFTSGGGEANHTAVACALTDRYEGFVENGVISLDKQPVLYVSKESHHSLAKAARLMGLGNSAVHPVALTSDLKLCPSALESAIKKDKEEGRDPFLVAATVGTTNAGVIDDLAAIGAISRRYRLWFHVDAAWGGAAIVVPELRGLLNGIESADSITFDCHKWLSAPMGAGLFLARKGEILDRTFRTTTDYMPKDGTRLGFVDPYATSMQWSRRFIGLKVFMALAERGWAGYGDVIRHHVEMGALLRSKLTESNWRVVNKTDLPVVCFQDTGDRANHQAYLERLCRSVVSMGDAWISTTVLGGSTHVLRACITSYRTREHNLDRLIECLDLSRARSGEPVS